jgi:hypothetical protein
LDLGAVAAYNGTCIQRLRSIGALGTTDCEAHLTRFCRLFRQYAGMRRRGLCKSVWIKRIKKNAVGTASKGFLKFPTAGATKNRALLPFVVRLVCAHEHALQASGKHGVELAKCGRRYMSVYRIMRRCARRFPSAQTRERLARTMLEGLEAWKAAGGHCYPKNHMCLHLARRARLGFAKTSLDADEAHHKIVKRIYKATKLPQRFLTKMCLIFSRQYIFFVYVHIDLCMQNTYISLFYI